MKTFLQTTAVSILLFLLCMNNSFGQCNVNDKYDKIISGYHSSIALKDNGIYAIWGSSMKNDGSTDQLSPQDMNATNYTLLTGTIYKAALGGLSANLKVDQGVLLTSTGLWAWGVEGNVLKNSLTAASTFGRITSPTGGYGSTTLGLPTGVTPTDVQSIFATYQTLIVLTKIVSGVGGDVYILTQTSRAVEANGGTATLAGNAYWQKVKINSTTDLTNVTAVRGQVYNISNNAFMAVTSAGLVYTWGNTSYLGNASAVTARNYATQMTMPTESSVAITPKMIGVTGGGGTGATTVKNTYYVLSTTGNLYSLGDNSQKQCGDFTTTERTSWVQVKKSAAAGDYLTNINFFSCQEHNASFPSVVVINTSGIPYSWGNNNAGMIGRTDDGTAGGTLTTVSFDPGQLVGFTGKAISAEVGGHTLVYTKEGSTQFCYVGHYTNGSMGDGTAGSNGNFPTSLKHDCTSTPNITICGSVPVSASAVNSTITASVSTILADGSSTSTLTIQLKDASNVNLTSSGGVVLVTTNAGTTSTVVDNNNGTYTVILTSSSSPATAVVHYTINGTAATSSASVTFSSILPLTWGNVIVYRKNKDVKIEWYTQQEQNVSFFDIERSIDGVHWETIITKIPASNTTSNHRYESLDNNYNPARLFYRIKQYDNDGKYTYSPVRMVLPFEESAKVMVYPVPVHTTFQVGNVVPANVKQVDLFTVNGIKIKSWRGFQPSFDASGINSGIYILRVSLIDGSEQNIKLNKL